MIGHALTDVNENPAMGGLCCHRAAELDKVGGQYRSQTGAEGVGIREAIKSRQSAAAVVALVMIVGAAIAIYVQARDTGGGSGKVYFSIDDGKTFFADKGTRLPPFDKDGRAAYRAHVFECGGKRVVGFLSRYTPEALRALDEAQAARGTGKPPPNVRALASIGTYGLEVKRPGDPVWVSQADTRRATWVRVFRCPDGSTPSEVDP